MWSVNVKWPSCRLCFSTIENSWRELSDTWSRVGHSCVYFKGMALFTVKFSKQKQVLIYLRDSTRKDPKTYLCESSTLNNLDINVEMWSLKIKTEI